LFGLAAFAAAPLAAAPVTVKHASGETTLKDTPKKLVVFDLASLDNLDALGVPVAGVPSGVKPAWLQQYNDDKVTKVGTLFEPNHAAGHADEDRRVRPGLARQSPRPRRPGGWRSVRRQAGLAAEIQRRQGDEGWHAVRAQPRSAGRAATGPDHRGRPFAGQIR